MSEKEKKVKKKIFLIVGQSWVGMVKKNKEFFSKKGIIFYNIIDKSKKKKVDLKDIEKVFDKVIFTNFSKQSVIFKDILDFKDEVVAVNAYGDAGVTYLSKIVSFFPDLYLPTSDSIKWSNKKNKMREFFEVYDKKITPKFLVIKEYSEKELDRIEKKIEYPLMLKPTNMASSKMVTKCYHRDELDNALKNIFNKGGFLQALRLDFLGGGKKTGVEVVAEEFMEGKMFSVDGLVDNDGEIIIYPPVGVKTGKEIGFDDFFGYKRIAPTKLNDKNINKINELTGKVVKSLMLRSTHFHLEVIRTEEGFKVVEIGTRLGGHREIMYEKAYGFSISKNDLLNKLNLVKKDSFDFKPIGNIAVLYFFAEKEGKIKKISGQRKIEKIESVESVVQNKKIGDMAKFAKNGGGAVFIITVSNSERGKLLGDIRKIEEELKIIV